MDDRPTLVQGTDEWEQARCGFATASRVFEITDKVKGGGPRASRKNYRTEKVIERLTNVPQNRLEKYNLRAVEEGKEREAEARDTYALRTDQEVIEVGFVRHPTIEWAGASPDGLVADDGEVQFKCPNPATHWETLRYGEIPLEYIAQMQFGMACTGRQWCDYVSYCPTFPVRRRMKIIRVARSTEAIVVLETEVRKFLAEVEAELKWEAAA